jgi:flagellar basal body-associated protein FliL
LKAFLFIPHPSALIPSENRMQRCPKCGRTYQDDNQKFCTFDGGRLEQPSASESAPTVVDLNKTMQAGFPPPPPPPPQQQPGSTAPIVPPPDLNRTVMGGPSTPTSEFQSHPTGPTQGPTSSPLQSPATSNPLPPAPVSSQQLPPPGVVSMPPPQPLGPASAPLPSANTAPLGKKSSKLPWILGVVAVLLLLGLGAGGVLLWFITGKGEKSRTGTTINTTGDEKANTNANQGGNDNTATAQASPTATAVQPPPNSTQFVNTRRNLNSLLTEHYADFSFYYPRSWELDTKAGSEGSSNFVKVERKLPPDFTQENFAVGYYESNGTVEADRPVYPSLVRSFDSKLSAAFPEYRKVSEGETKINSLSGYEFRFQSISRGTEKGDITIWGRVVFLPPGTEGDKRGVTLLMLATSVAPELTSIDDVGVRGELPVILNTFKLGQ